ncbi:MULTISPECIES: gamma-glutamyltransferase [unclassified Oleiphilus]|uniref:gamma-glutamyltransferase n=2 Tax=Oleiphilus TaxID=141450 RepID=UPI0007C3D032|nr:MULTISPECIES: gamma-glutamyltransferase [unclassified Oleiphilus]KZY69067.1 hypothetical protein A3739_01060 [Oleiphilus sp. HI0067]KZY69384.1 hypothetical protein A3738_04055 [Oleiphilus sp. HI0066]
MKATLLLLISLTASFVHAAQQSEFVEPESSTDLSQSNNPYSDLQKVAQNDTQMVVTAHPLASKAGAEILNQGGNAIDAMVTIQAVLGLVEPQSSGLGGGVFTLFYKSDNQTLVAYDGRETAPLDAEKDLFLNKDQTQMGFFDAVVGGRSVGTPGTVATLWHMHQKDGSLPWARLLEPAISIAKEGFIVSNRMAQSVQRDQDRLSTHPSTAAYFLPEGEPLSAGTKLVNPEYAETLTTLAQRGGEYFYHKDFAVDIVNAVQSANNPGLLSIEDFKQYKVIERVPVCHTFIEHRVCGMGAPSSGAITVGQILMTSEAAGLIDYPPESPQAWHVIAESTRLAFADRALYIADPAYFDVPSSLLNEEYISERASQVNTSKKSPTLTAGSPFSDKIALSTGINVDQPSTTHFVVVDKSGNIISSTSTIENAFGSRVMVKGFLLNNELTDFSFKFENDKGLIANHVEAGKRPRSSMAPTIVFKGDTPVLAIGSPGGSRIINYVANSLIRLLAWGQPLIEAINAPHISNRYGDMDIEKDAWSDEDISALKNLGYKVNQRDLNSGLHAVQIRKDLLKGAADKRREGSANAR